MEETLEMKFTVSKGETGYEEIKKESYRYAKDTVKKGDSIDFLSFFCGVFALICMLIVLYFGTVGGFTNTMIYLMSVYVFVAFFCFCTPLQILISELLWNAGFKKRLAVNCGYEKELYLSEEEVKVAGKRGEECYSNYSECFFFETKSFIILNVTDRKLFPIVKEELDKKELEELRRFCINDYEEIESYSDDADEHVGESEGNGNVSEEHVGKIEEDNDDVKEYVGKTEGNNDGSEEYVGEAGENSDDSEGDVGKVEGNKVDSEKHIEETKENSENCVSVEDINETVESEKISEE